MTTFFEATTALDGKVDGSAEVDEIGIGLVLDIQLLLLLIFLVIGRSIRVALLVTSLLFAKNLCLDLLVFRLMLFVLCVKLEDVKSVLDLDVVFQRVPMCNLILLFH